MIDAIEEIQDILKGRTYKEFVQDPVRMHACVRLFEILGEAASKLTGDFRKAHSDIPSGYSCPREIDAYMTY